MRTDADVLGHGAGYRVEVRAFLRDPHLFGAVTLDRHDARARKGGAHQDYDEDDGARDQRILVHLLPILVRYYVYVLDVLHAAGERVQVLQRLPNRHVSKRDCQHTVCFLPPLFAQHRVVRLLLLNRRQLCAHRASRLYPLHCHFGGAGLSVRGGRRHMGL